MSKVTLEFDIYEEREELENAINGFRYAGAIEDIREYFRSTLKYGGDSLTAEQYEIIEKVQSEILEIINGIKF